MSEFTKRAKRELELAGLFKDNSDYDGMLGSTVMELVETFSKQGHSGMSASITSKIFKDLVDGKTLTPITSKKNEWMLVSDQVDNMVWQNRRRSTSFSRDGGCTWYDIEDSSLNNGDTWVKNEEKLF